MPPTAQDFQNLRKALHTHIDLRDAADRAFKWHSTGTHGSDKGDDYYTCRICDKDERR